MASFDNGNGIVDMIKNIERFANSEEVYTKMISEGQEIMKSAIENGAKKHIKTGKMAKSIKWTKPTKDKNGNWVGRVKFTGTDGKYVSKDGKKYDITNWLKAFRIEYGTSTEKAEPFVRPAIQGCQNDISNKWKELYDKEVKKLQWI